MQTEKKTQNYGMIDIMKFICAIMIVVAHFITENAEGRVNKIFEYSVSLYIIVVPFFFCCSGFLLFKKIFYSPENKRYKVISYCKRLMILYAGWSAIYILFNIATWIRFGINKDEFIKYIINSIFYSTYKTIWFIPALCVGTIVAYLFIQKLGVKKTLVIAIIIYIIGSLGVSYRFIIDKNYILERILSDYEYIFVSTRNGLFNAFPFVAIGAYIAKNVDKNENKIIQNFIMVGVFGVAFVVEAFFIKFKFSAPNANTLIMLLPFTYFFVKVCLNIKIPEIKGLLYMRKMSTAIFLCQRIFLTALPGLFPESWFMSLLNGNPYIGLVLILLMTLSLSAIIVYFSGKNKILSMFC